MSKNVLHLYFSLLLSSVGLVWFSQQSINAYWLQTYHQSSPLEYLDRFSWWKMGDELQTHTNTQYHLALEYLLEQRNVKENETILTKYHVAEVEKIADQLPIIRETNTASTPTETQDYTLTHQDLTSVPSLPPNSPLLATNPSELGFKNTVENVEVLLGQNTYSAQPMPIEAESRTTEESEAKAYETIQKQPENTPHLTNNIAEGAKTEAQNNEAKTINPLTKPQTATTPMQDGHIVLHQGDKVFFAGDSLMQGVAPFMQKYLKQAGINSINLSKQSTGLAYPNFFDWPKTIEQILQKSPDIRLLVIFLGPNDPWDIPNPKGGPYLRFKSEEWRDIYQSRITRILETARTHNVQVIWLGVPYMKAQKLNEQMRYLNEVLVTALQGKAIWLPTEKLLSNGTGHYVDSITVAQKILRVRSKDGIHFSPSGQKILAEYIQQQLIIQ